MNNEIQTNLTQKRALSITETAELAGVSRGTICNWLSQGLLPFEEFPSIRGNGRKRFRRIRKTDLDAFLDKYYKGYEHQTEAKSKPPLTLLPRDQAGK